MNGDKENFPWSADHVKRIGNLPVDLYSAICYDYDWWLRMVINISVQYSGGFLPTLYC